MSKKILQIKKGEYLHAVLHSGAVDTTYHTKFALDISHWKLETLGAIIDNLKKVGYNDAKVVTIEPEVKKIAENTFETANKIGKALKEVKESLDNGEV